VKPYFDSAVLVKAYCLEATTPQALALLRGVAPPLMFTPLHALEIRNALRLKRHRKELTQSQLRGSLESLREDIVNGYLGAVDLDLMMVYAQAELLSSMHAVSTGARSLDVLHVAAALILESDQFVSFDRRQRALATRSNLRILPRTLPTSA
jgi:predicted nucleic acid-binding protein